MQLARFKAISSTIENDESLLESLNSIRVFRKHNGIWYDAEDGTISDEDEIKYLNNTLDSNTSWRNKNSPRCFYPIHEIDIVVEGTFAAPPRSEKRKRIGKRIESCYSNAVNAYGVTHNELTGLINKTEFKRLLESKISSYGMPGSSETVLAEADNPISVISLDIDFFKQVNDTFGHQYGDIVLKVFAHRLQKKSEEISSMKETIDAIASHLSGEEFSIILSGAKKDEVVDIAERYRESISSQPLPSEKEWGIYRGYHTGQLPHSSDRKVSASVGVSTKIPQLGNISADELSEDMQHEADMALYRAKAVGRNIVIQFDDILDKYGQILEHHLDTNIVAVDIGEQCNVQFGQEFLVYHPDFSGKKTFIYSDGRSNKALGTYPKIPCGRIAAFDIQKDICFCKIIEKEINGQFPAGSILEAVKMGSIGHLLAHSHTISGHLNMNQKFAPSENIEDAINETIDNNISPGFAVFTIRNISILKDERGIAFINDALATLYKVIEDVFPNKTKICQLSPYEFGVVCVDEGIEMHSDDVMNRFNNHFSNMVELAIGFVPSYYLELNEIDSFSGFELATYAVSLSLANESDNVVEFKNDTAEKIIRLSSDADKDNKVLDDFDKFRTIGIREASIGNIAAISAFNIGDFSLSKEALGYAIEISPEYATYYANLGLIEFALGNRINSFRAFEMARDLEPDIKIPNHYKLACAMSKYAAYEEEHVEVDLQEIKDILTLYLKSPDRYNTTSIEVDNNEVASIISSIK